MATSFGKLNKLILVFTFKYKVPRLKNVFLLKLVMLAATNYFKSRPVFTEM